MESQKTTQSPVPKEQQKAAGNVLKCLEHDKATRQKLLEFYGGLDEKAVTAVLLLDELEALESAANFEIDKASEDREQMLINRVRSALWEKHEANHDGSWAAGILDACGMVAAGA